MKNILANISTTIASRIIKGVLTLLSAIFISRYFGPENKGIFVLVTTLPLLALNLGNLGLINANIFFTSKNENDSKNLFYNSCWLGLFLGLFFIGIFSLFLKLNPQIFFNNLQLSYIAMILIITPFMFWESFFQGIFLGQKKYYIFNLVQIIPYSLIFLGTIFGRIFLTMNIYYISLLATCSFVLPAIIYFVILTKQYGLKWHFDTSLIKKELGFGFRAYIASIMSYLILRSDIYLVNTFLDLKDVGLYSVAVNLSESLLLITNATSLVLFPQITSKPEDGLKMTLRASKIVSLLMIISFAVIYLLAKPLVNILFGSQFKGSLPSLYILMPASFFWSLITILSMYFASKGFPWKAVWIWIPGLIINISINLIFLPRFGLIIASLSSLIAYAITFWLHYKYLSSRDNISLKDILLPSKKEIKDTYSFVKKALITK